MRAFWMLLAAFVFATMGVCVKVASQWYGTGEIVFWRGVVGIVLIWALARYHGVSLGTRHPMMHVWRTAVGVSAITGWFYAIGRIPLATAMTLNYMSSVWIAAFVVAKALLSGLRAKTRSCSSLPTGRAHPALLGCVLLGFAGVVLALKPTAGAGSVGLAGLAGLISGMSAALALMQVVALARSGEPEDRTVFYFMVGSAATGAAIALTTGGFAPWSPNHALWLVAVGLLAALGQVFMTHAYSGSQSPNSTLLVANLQYSGIIFAASYSVILFKEPIDSSEALGMILIVGSAVVATVARSRHQGPATQAPAALLADLPTSPHQTHQILIAPSSPPPPAAASSSPPINPIIPINPKDRGG